MCARTRAHAEGSLHMFSPCLRLQIGLQTTDEEALSLSMQDSTRVSWFAHLNLSLHLLQNSLMVALVCYLAKEPLGDPDIGHSL